MKIYKIINGKCTTISVVEEPAIEEDFIKLKSDKLYKFDQQILIGPALVPDKPIYRNDEHGEYYISFDASSIKQIAADYLKNLEVSIDHEHSIPATVLESWIKESENDKSVDYGFDLPVGTWFVKIHIDNEEVWQDIKNNKYGFSIELNAMLFNKQNEVIVDKDAMDNEIKALSIERDEALGKLNDALTELETVKAERDALKAERDELLKERDSLKEQLDEALSVNEDLKKEIESLKNDKDKIVEDNTAIIEELQAKLSKQPTANPIKRNPYADAIKFILNK